MGAVASSCSRVTWSIRSRTGSARRNAMDMAGIDWTKLGASVPAVVMTVIGDQFRLYGRVLPLSTDLVADLGSEDDIEKLEVLMTMEELFGLRFGPNVATSVRTVGDVVSLVEEGLALQGNSSASSVPPEDL
jgi:acyl carrier protein